MDDRLRQAERRFRETGTLQDEIAYLRELRRAQQITDDQLEKAAYFGSKAANEIVPYDTPYELARLMRYDPPEPPETSWFCNDIYKGRNLHDISDIWCQLDLIGTEQGFEEVGYETALFMNLLLLYWITQTNIQLEDMTIWWGPVARAYNQLRDALVNQTPAEGLTGAGIPPAVGLLWEMVNDYLGDETAELDIPVDLRWVSEQLLEASMEHQRRALCDFVSNQLRKYLLGYITLEELLPRI